MLGSFAGMQGENPDSSSIRDAIGNYALVLQKTDQALGIMIKSA